MILIKIAALYQREKLNWHLDGANLIFPFGIRYRLVDILFINSWDDGYLLRVLCVKSFSRNYPEYFLGCPSAVIKF
jgi:hypothetical protein